jgi:hypothetical protein
MLSGQADISAADRMETYVWFVDQLAARWWGLGLGINANGISTAEGTGLRDLDSGIVEVFLAFGLVLGTVWFTVYGWILLIGADALKRSSDPVIVGSALIVLSSFIHLWFGTPFNADSGMVLWPFIGLLLASRRGADRRI